MIWSKWFDQQSFNHVGNWLTLIAVHKIQFGDIWGIDGVALATGFGFWNLGTDPHLCDLYPVVLIKINNKTIIFKNLDYNFTLKKSSDLLEYLFWHVREDGKIDKVRISSIYILYFNLLNTIAFIFILPPKGYWSLIVIDSSLPFLSSTFNL